MIALLDFLSEKFFFVCALISSLIVILIFAFIIVFSFPFITDGQWLNLLTQDWHPSNNHFGIFPMIVGTLFISFLAIIFSFPLSIGTAIFIGVTGPKFISNLLKKIVQLMTGIPTVIYGFVGIFLIVPIIRELFHAGSGMCILSASLVLSVMISPTMILFFIDSFERVSPSYIQAAESFGANRIQKLVYIIIPCSLNGILTGITLSLGRAIGDTLIALMIAGNAILVPTSVFDPARTLTSHIALVIAADYNSLEFRSIFACGLILYIFTTALIFLIRGFNRKVQRVSN